MQAAASGSQHTSVGSWVSSPLMAESLDTGSLHMAHLWTASALWQAV